MARLYDDAAYFSDPAFRTLTAEETRAMWRMLILRSKGELHIAYHSVEEKEDHVSGVWEATYTFGKTGRKVHNIIKSKMIVEEGKIIVHEDQFNLWKWSRMALGTSGLLLGWTPWIQGRIHAQARNGLRKFMESEGISPGPDR